MSETELIPWPQSRVMQFLRGASYPFRSIAILRRYKLWGWTAAAIAVNIALLFALLMGLHWAVSPLLHKLDAAFASFAGPSESWNLFLRIVSVVIWGAIYSLLAALSALLLLLVGQAVASPFLDLLSEQVEQRVLQTQPQPFGVKRVVMTVLIALGDLCWGGLLALAVYLPMLAIGFIPGIGTGAAAVISFIFTALLLAHEFVGLSLVRHLVSYRARWRIILHNRYVALGLGTSLMLVFVIPGLNLILLPLAAVAGTLAFCELKQAGRLQYPGAS